MPHEQVISYFSKYIEKEIGIVYASHNEFQLINRLEEISKLMGVQNLDELYNLAQKGMTTAFRQLLLDVATNNETSFFRDIKVFNALEIVITSDYLGGEQPLRVWSAASSSGQEALTIAMLVNELKQKNGKDLALKILASDISERILDKARKGCYSQLEVQRGLPVSYLIRYFSKDDQDRWTVKKSLQSSIEYRKINLNDFVSPTEKFQIILCRNVLIYLSVKNKMEVVRHLTDCLADGGYLVLGAGESMLGISSCYEQQSLNGAILYRKKPSHKMVA